MSWRDGKWIIIYYVKKKKNFITNLGVKKIGKIKNLNFKKNKKKKKKKKY